MKTTNSPIALFQYARIAEAARQSDTKKMIDHGTAPTKDVLLNHPTLSQARADLRGIVNLGSACYLSASIHLLRACPRLRDALTQDPFPNVIDMSLVIPAKPALFKSYLKLRGDIRSTMREVERIEVVNPCSPARLLRTLPEQKPNWDQNNQQDAMEAFEIMQHALHEITNKASARRFSQQYAVDRPMAASAGTHWSDVQKDQSSSEGEDPFLLQAVYIKRFYTCHARKENTFETFTSLILQLPSQITATSLGQAAEIDQLLRFRFQEETLDDGQCDAYGPAKMYGQLVITRPSVPAAVCSWSSCGRFGDNPLERCRQISVISPR